MIGHDQARELASAAHDGELAARLRPALTQHLEQCAPCQVFSTGLVRLTEAVTAAPRELAPRSLPQRVRAATRSRRVRRWSWSLAPLATAAAVLVMIVLTNGAAPGGVFPLPAAGAATPLLELTSVYVEREVETVRTLSEGQREVETTIERIWFSAPGLLRVERTTTTPTGTESDLLIERPGGRFTTQDGLKTGRSPAIVLPEPLSPTLAELGRDLGPGPSVAGRATRRIELEAGGETRVALVDADRPYVLGSAQSVVLGKSPLRPELGPFTESVTKRVLSIDLDADLDPARFTLPDVAGIDDGFRAREVEDLLAAPDRLPAGFRVVQAGRGPAGDALLMARGALPVLIEVTATSPTDQGAQRTELLDIGGRPVVVGVPLYGTPWVRLSVDDQVVTISAPLPTASLVDLAQLLYPRE